MWVGSFHPKSSLGVHRPYGTRNNDVSNTSSNSNFNPNSNAGVPMPRFTNGQFFASIGKILFLGEDWALG